MRGLPGLKRIRQKSGLTQEALAKLVGVHLMTINRYETGKQDARFAVVCKIAQALNCAERELLFPER